MTKDKNGTIGSIFKGIVICTGNSVSTYEIK